MTGTIARWTTPSITYKPSQVQVEDIGQIYVVLKQNGIVKLKKSINDASKSVDGFTWQLTQDDTKLFKSNVPVVVQVDYKTIAGQRYTTMPSRLDPAASAVDEEF